MIGIYKITSPTGKIYIGQSTNILKRWNYYKKLYCKKQIRLIRSFIKYGVINHFFEVIEECNYHELNDKERYYQELYNCIGSKGLNCVLTKSNDKSGKVSIETMLRMRKKNSDTNKFNYLKKIILDTNTGIYFIGVKEASLAYGLNEGTLRSKLTNHINNNTNLIYV